MLQKPAHDGDDGDIVRLPFDARDEAADAAHDEPHFDARLARFHKFFDKLLIGERIHLGGDEGGLPFPREGDLPVDALDEPLFEPFGRDEKALVVVFRVADGDVAEERRAVLADLLVRRDDVEIGVLLARLFVVISRAEVGDIADLPLFGQEDGDDLGMHFEVLHPVDDGAARLLQDGSKIHVVLLVEAGAQLDDDGDFLAVLAGALQRLHDAGMAVEAVDGDLDGDDALILRALVEKADERFHAVVRVREEHVPFLDAGDEALRGQQIFRDAPLEGSIAQRRELLFLKIALQREEELIVHIPLELEAVLLFEVEVFEQERLDRPAVFVDLHAHGVLTGTVLHLVLHVGRKVEVVFEVGVVHAGIEIGVAGDAHERLGNDGVAREGERAEFGDEVFERDEVDLPAARDAEEPLGRGRHRHDADHRPAVAEQFVDEIDVLIFKADERVLRIEHHGREQGQHRREEVVEAERALARRELVRAHEAHPARIQLLCDGLIDGSALFIQLFDLGKDDIELFFRRELRLVFARIGGEPLFVEEAPHAHHEELVEIALKDRKELAALEERVGDIGRLIEHAAVKEQPAVLAVAVDALDGRFG